ncbi:MAG: HD domain-containing protein [Kiritimatiellia bacterium]
MRLSAAYNRKPAPQPPLPVKKIPPAPPEEQAAPPPAPPPRSAFSLTAPTVKSSLPKPPATAVPPAAAASKKPEADLQEPAPGPAPAPEAEPDVSGRDKLSATAPGAAPAPAGTSGTPEQAQNSLYNNSPAGILEVCMQFGIMVPTDRSSVIVQAKSCLVTVFKKITLPSSEKYMIWPMIKSIASDLEEFTESSAAILNVLHRDRMQHETLAWHSIYTAIIAMSMAKHERALPCSLHELGGAALIHDAGFLFLRNAFDDIENERNPESTGHVAKGVELAKIFETGEAVIKMIALHHGRLDGKGFPRDLAHADFGRCCQVLALANTAEMMLCDMAFGQPEGGEEEHPGGGLSRILNEYRRAYDTDLLKKMISLIGFYPAGSMVELNNRMICKVVRQNANFPLRPVVQVVMDSSGMHPDEEKLLDLKEVKILSIIRTLAAPEIREID